MSTCAYAASRGDLKKLQRLHIEEGRKWDVRTCYSAAANGHLEVLQWARANGCPWDERTCSHAAANDHLDVLRWAHDNDCPWNMDTCRFAAWKGHFEVLKWVRANGCPWDRDACLEDATSPLIMDWIDSGAGDANHGTRTKSARGRVR